VRAETQFAATKPTLSLVTPESKASATVTEATELHESLYRTVKE